MCTRTRHKSTPTLKDAQQTVDAQVEVVAASEGRRVGGGGIEQRRVPCPAVEPEVGACTQPLEDAEAEKGQGQGHDAGRLSVVLEYLLVHLQHKVCSLQIARAQIQLYTVHLSAVSGLHFTSNIACAVLYISTAAQNVFFTDHNVCDVRLTVNTRCAVYGSPIVEDVYLIVHL